MVLETKTTLEDQTLEQLQKLTRANIDAYYGLKEAAEQINDTIVADLFHGVARERSQIVDELKTYIEWNGEDVPEDGTFAASVHRTWIDIRGMISGGDAYAILAEAERGEDHIKTAYEDVLTQTAGSAMNDVLQEQYMKVKSGHDCIRDLRDQYKTRRKDDFADCSKNPFISWCAIRNYVPHRIF